MLDFVAVGDVMLDVRLPAAVAGVHAYLTRIDASTTGSPLEECLRCGCAAAIA